MQWRSRLIQLDESTEGEYLSLAAVLGEHLNLAAVLRVERVEEPKQGQNQWTVPIDR